MWILIYSFSDTYYVWAACVNTCEKANNMVAWTVSTVRNWVAQTVNTREKATNMVAWIFSTTETRVAPTVKTREITTPAEEQILTMKNTGNRMSPTVSKGKQQHDDTTRNMTYKTDFWTAHNNPNKNYAHTSEITFKNHVAM